jgi:hypothetical protein
LIEVTAVNEARNLWPGFYKVTDAANHIFIFVAPNAAHIIPKRAFTDKESALRFYQRARELFEEAHPKAVYR